MTMTVSSWPKEMGVIIWNLKVTMRNKLKWKKIISGKTNKVNTLYTEKQAKMSGVWFGASIHILEVEAGALGE